MILSGASQPHSPLLHNGWPDCSIAGEIFLCIIQRGHKENEMVPYCAAVVWH